jgi:diamine N-acetyltransferase
MSPMTTATPPIIRTPGVDEAPGLRELGIRTFRDTYAAETGSEDMDAFLADAYRVADLETELTDPRHRWLVADVGGELAGFAHLHDGERHEAVAGERPVLLAHLYLDRAYQGIGLGSELMRRCLGEARAAGRDVIWLGVWERNPRAIAFYERWGFEAIGEMPFTFGAEQHRDIVMARGL